MLELTNPRQTVLITCRGNIKNEYTNNLDNKDNIIPLDWHMPCSMNHYAIALSKDRHSHELIQYSRVFVVNFMSHKHAKAVDICGRISGRFKDKFKAAKLTSEEADQIDCSRIVEACAHLECQVINDLDVEDHMIFIGKILGKIHKGDDDRLFHKLHGEYGTVKTSLS